jgi:hypothetical protein
MGVMTEDGKFETFLEREARGFNEPPAEVPREAMWEAIAAARAASRPHAGGVAPSGAPDLAGVTPITAARPRRALRFAPWIGMAATLVLGLGIGRYMIAREMGTVPAVDSLAVAASRVTSGATATPPSAVDAAATGTVRADVRPVAPLASPRLEATRLVATRSATRPAVRAASLGGTPVPDEPARRDGGSATYSVASQQHLTRAEALVAVVSAMPADAAPDSLTGRWARDVLTNTRLLLDSPAGDDPARRRLLEDLETLLVQLVQRSGRTAEDRAMIDRTLQKTQILTRLRSGATGT